MSNKNGLLRQLEELRQSADEAFVERESTNRWVSAFSHMLIDATLLSEEECLTEAVKLLRRLYTSSPDYRPSERDEARLTALAEVTQAALDRTRHEKLKNTLDPSSLGACLLFLVQGLPDISSDSIATMLFMESPEASMALRTLSRYGLVVEVESTWRITPSGNDVAQGIRSRMEAK